MEAKASVSRPLFGPARPSVFALVALLIVSCWAVAYLVRNQGLFREPLIALGLEVQEVSFLSAIRDGDVARVRAGLNAGISPNARSFLGMPALGMARREKQADVIRVLIERGADTHDYSRLEVSSLYGPLANARAVGLTECDRLSYSPWDPNHPVFNDLSLQKELVAQSEWMIDPQKAVPACRRQIMLAPGMDRFKHQLALALRQAGNVDEARAIFRELSDRGYIDATYQLAHMIEQGRGGWPDPKTAEVLYYRCAAQNHPMCLLSLGYLNDWGKGVAQNSDNAEGYYARSIKELSRLANRGHWDAQTAIARLSKHGTGVPKSEKKSCELFLQVAREGNLEGMHEVGVCYSWGRVWGTDFRKAAAFYKLAAAQEFPWAMYDLARMVWYRKNGTGKKLSIALFKRCAELALPKCMDALVRAHTDGKAVDKNLREAAHWTLESGRFGGRGIHFADRKDVMVALQLLLKELGLYSGAVNGEQTAATKVAMSAYYHSPRPLLPPRPRRAWIPVPPSWTSISPGMM